MTTSIVTSVIAYISTNIDDIFVVMLLLAQAGGMQKHKLIAGHFLGVALLTAISMLGAMGLQNLPLKYVGILGLVPIGLGIRAWFHRNEAETEAKAVGLLGMTAITLGNGADNIGVYLPLFTGFSGVERAVAVAIFAVMTALWVWLAHSMAAFPKVKAVIGKYKRILIPIVFVLLGVYILFDSGLLG